MNLSASKADILLAQFLCLSVAAGVSDEQQITWQRLRLSL